MLVLLDLQKNLNGINIAIVISLVASQRVAEISKWWSLR